MIIACSPHDQQNAATIRFFKQDHDFGNLKFKIPGECTFVFENPGKSALLIYNVKTSCGCAAPEWTKRPIKPGTKGEINIKYNSEFPGIFHKTIMVYFNGANSPTILKIKGKVEYPDSISKIEEE
jgi:hypothetical protein